MKATQLLTMLVIFLLTYRLAVGVDLVAQQRLKFKEAHQFLLKEDFANFEKWMSQLKDYPIVHYLRYFYLTTHLSNSEDIQAFLEQYKDSPITDSLRQKWLRYLAENRKWELFLKFYLPQTDAMLQCSYLQAHLNSNLQLSEKAIKQAKKLWLVGTSQPKVCDEVFDYLHEKGILTDELYWRRIRLAMQKNDVTLASYLTKHLLPADQAWVTLWKNLHQTPERELKTFKQPDTSLVREMLLHGLKRLAQEEAGKAYSYWEEYKKSYNFSVTESGEIFRYIALKSAEQGYAKASQWLSQVEHAFINEDVNSAKLKIALSKPEWPAILALFQSLANSDKAKPAWQYWQARALEQMGNIATAEKIFRTIAQKRSYYGFLAAERLGEPYQFEFQPLSSNKELEQKLLANLGIIRTQELYLGGLTEFAQREWEQVLTTLTVAELKAAALLLHRWGWHYQVIATLGKIGALDDLKILFPIPFYEVVLRYAPAYNIEMAWVYAILRQESAFQIDARSPKGALGLMQLLPTTAQQVADKYHISMSSENLSSPENNIELGTAYLRELLDKFNGNHLLATVAYDAGPSRAQQWANRYPCVAPDIWVELIPSAETQNYVRRVMSYTIIFENQLDKTEKPGPMPLEMMQKEGC